MCSFSFSFNQNDQNIPAHSDSLSCRLTEKPVPPVAPRFSYFVQNVNSVKSNGNNQYFLFSQRQGVKENAKL